MSRFLRVLRRLVWAAFALGATGVVPASADVLTVQVLGPNAEPVPEVAVFVEGSRLSAAARAAPPTAVMDQVDKRFVPHVLVVRTGTLVEFPNRDVVAHHVYSFSKPNDFTLPLYKGTPPEPVKLDHAGIVTLGCNIHDQMLGYVVVVDSDTFGVTDASGTVELPIDDMDDDFTVRIWSARLKDGEEHLAKHVSSATNDKLVFAMTKKLRPRHDDQTETVNWSDY